MRKFIKVFVIVLILLLVAAIAVPVIFKDKIIALVKTEANKNLNAKFDFKDLDISLIRNFPNLGLTISELSIVGIDEFKNDTLIYAKSVNAAVDLWKVIGGSETEIKKIFINDPHINLIGLKNGRVNWDIAKPSADTAEPGKPSAFKISLNKYKITNGNIQYRDDALNYSLSLIGLNHEGSGDFTEDIFTLATETKIDKASTSYGGVAYLYNASASLKADLEMDMKNFKFTFKQNELVLNDMPLNFDGWLAMPADDITMDIKFSSPKNDFKNFMSLIPGVYREGFKDVKSSGTMAFSGKVKGTYNDKSMPGFGLNVDVNNGMFQYSSLPTPINNVNLELKIINPDGVPDNTNINLKKLHFEIGSEPFDARLSLVTPVSNAKYDAMMKGKINLAAISSIIPLEKGTTLSGQINTDLAVKGDMKSIEQKNYAAIHAAGNFSMMVFNYKSIDFPKGIAIDKMMMTFNPQNVTLSDFTMRAGHTDLHAKGSLDNLIAYCLKPDQLLKGSLVVSSNQIDLNEFISQSAETEDKKPPADTAKMNVVIIPENIEFVMSVRVNRLLYDNVILSNINGNVSIRDHTLGLNGLVFNTFDGTVGMEGIYQTRDKKNPVFNYSLDLKNLDIKQTVTTFNTVKKMAPVAERCNGKYSSQFTIAGKLDEHMQPVMSTLNGAGKLQTQAVTVSNFEPLNKLADALKMQQFKQLAINNLNISFKFNNGRVFVEPFETSWNGARVKIGGSNGFDQTIDYNVNLAVPKAIIPASATSVITGLLGQLNSKIGTNLSVPDPVNFKINLGGSISSPTVKTSLADGGKEAVENVKAKVEEEVNKKIDETKAKAQQEVDKAKKEAEAKAKAEADKIKKEAEEKAAKAKKEAEDKLKKEAEKNLKNIFGNPKK